MGKPEEEKTGNDTETQEGGRMVGFLIGLFISGNTVFLVTAVLMYERSMK